jgi:DNA-3-methyladenine glycosylase
MNLHISAQIVEPNWLARPSTEVAPDLIGCTLVRQLPDGTRLRGMIVETEAYSPDDPACHAYRRRTERNGVMFGPAGRTYVYLIYGIYYCLNIVTDLDEVPSAVLIRALAVRDCAHLGNVA